MESNDTNTMPSAPVNDQSSISGTSRPWVYFSYIVWLIIDLLILLAFTIGGIPVLFTSNPGFGIFSVIFVLLLIVLFHNDLKLPFRTTITGSVLSTAGLLGRKTVDLSQPIIGSVISYTPGRFGYSNRLIKLKTSSGKKIYLGLGALETTKRQQIIQAIRPYLTRSDTQIDSRALRQLERWT